MDRLLPKLITFSDRSTLLQWSLVSRQCLSPSRKMLFEHHLPTIHADNFAALEALLRSEHTTIPRLVRHVSLRCSETDVECWVVKVIRGLASSHILLHRLTLSNLRSSDFRDLVEIFTEFSEKPFLTNLTQISFDNPTTMIPLSFTQNISLHLGLEKLSIQQSRTGGVFLTNAVGWDDCQPPPDSLSSVNALIKDPTIKLLNWLGTGTCKLQSFTCRLFGHREYITSLVQTDFMQLPAFTSLEELTLVDGRRQNIRTNVVDLCVLYPDFNC